MAELFRDGSFLGICRLSALLSANRFTETLPEPAFLVGSGFCCTFAADLKNGDLTLAAENERKDAGWHPAQ